VRSLPFLIGWYVTSAPIRCGSGAYCVDPYLDASVRVEQDAHAVGQRDATRWQNGEQKIITGDARLGVVGLIYPTMPTPVGWRATRAFPQRSHDISRLAVAFGNEATMPAKMVRFHPRPLPVCTLFFLLCPKKEIAAIWPD
jgi:hypothetical protein